MHRKVTSSCGLSGARRPRSMACPQAHVRCKAWAQTGCESPLCPHADAPAASSWASAGEPDRTHEINAAPPDVIPIPRRNGFQPNVTLAYCPILYTGQLPAVEARDAERVND